MTVKYDLSKGILAISLQLKSTVFANVIRRYEFYALLGFHLLVNFAIKIGYLEPAEDHVQNLNSLSRMTGTIAALYVVFYNGHVFVRFNSLYELTKSISEECLHAVAVLTREIPSKVVVRKLARLMIASAFVFFFEVVERSEDVSSKITTEQWRELRSLGLLTQREVQLLDQHCKKGGCHSTPSLLLLHWLLKCYRLKIRRIAEFEKAVRSIRQSQKAVMGILELPMPFQYHQLMNQLVCFSLTLWAYTFALKGTYVATLIFLAIQMTIQGLLELSVSLADPFGGDDEDFPLNRWVQQLYARVSSTVEDPVTTDIIFPKHPIGPLPVPKPGTFVCDVMHDGRMKTTGKLSAMACMHYLTSPELDVRQPAYSVVRFHDDDGSSFGEEHEDMAREVSSQPVSW
eukprot:TRINITY_DN33859_c0_g1_i1.p1 TRINITY_DN33859_c0_g1~~TRINITY_DN33859_c0_g1_i1.p1  ORF type:complete len:401 (-),score=50.12 TRINITY_DN33859_c0_g1_i1:15-1217(-)